jgi:hypothetical protein
MLVQTPNQARSTDPQGHADTSPSALAAPPPTPASAHPLQRPDRRVLSHRLMARFRLRTSKTPQFRDRLETHMAVMGGAIWGRVMGVVSFIVFSKPTCSGSSCQSDCMVARVRGRFSAFRVQFTVLNSPHSWVGASTPGDKTAALAWLSPSEASRRQAARPGVPQRPGVALAPRLRRNDSRQAYGAAPPRRMTPILAAERRRGDGSATSPPRPLGGSVGQMTYR